MPVIVNYRAMANRRKSSPPFNRTASPTSALPPDAAFFGCIRTGDVGAVKNVLATRKGAADWQQTSNGQRGLHVVAMTGQRKIAAELVKAGADIEARDHLGRTPLAQAARSGQQNIIDFLLLQKADIHAADKKGNTPLHLAAEGISADTIIMLINRGADAMKRNHDGATPADLALAGGNQAMAAVIRSEARKRADDAGRAGAEQNQSPDAAAPDAAVPPHETARDIDALRPLNLRKRPPRP